MFLNAFREDWRDVLLLVVVFAIALIGSKLPWVGSLFGSFVLIAPPAIAVMVMKVKRGLSFVLAPALYLVAESLLAYLVTPYSWSGSSQVGIISLPFCGMVYLFWDDL